MKPQTLRTLLALTSAGLLLTGCAGNVVDPAPIETVQAKGQTGKAKQPDKPVPMSVATFQALRGDGLYYFDNAAGPSKRNSAAAPPTASRGGPAPPRFSGTAGRWIRRPPNPSRSRRTAT